MHLHTTCLFLSSICIDTLCELLSLLTLLLCPRRELPGAPVFRSNHVQVDRTEIVSVQPKTLFSSLRVILAQSRRPPQILSTTECRFETVCPME